MKPHTSQRLLYSLLILLAGMACAGSIKPLPRTTATLPIAVWLTTPDGANHITPQAGLNWRSAPTLQLPGISLDVNATYQTVLGFGAAMTQTASSLLAQSPNESALLASLFGSSGINMTLLRDPLGSPDFSDAPFFSYSSGPGAFSLGHDQKYTIPVLQAAQQLNPALVHIAAPWSPPAWMKTTGSMVGGTLATGEEAAFASYLVQAVQAYQAAGIPIAYLSAQNEPSYVSPTYPGSGWDAATETSFLGQNLLPALSAAGLNTTVLLSDDQVDPTILASFVADSAGLNVDTAAHCYNGVVNASQARGLLLETECATSITSYASTAADPLKPLDALIDWMRAGASSFLYWNIAADQHLEPNPIPGSICACTPLITVQTSNGVPTGQVTYNPEYWALGMVSEFVRPGAVIVASSTNNRALKEVAFKNADGSVVLVVRNTSASTQLFRFGTPQQYAVNGIPAGAIETFKW